MFKSTSENKREAEFGLAFVLRVALQTIIKWFICGPGRVGVGGMGVLGVGGGRVSSLLLPSTTRSICDQTSSTDIHSHAHGSPFRAHVLLAVFRDTLMETSRWVFSFFLFFNEVEEQPSQRSGPSNKCRALKAGAPFFFLLLITKRKLHSWFGQVNKQTRTNGLNRRHMLRRSERNVSALTSLVE